MVCQPQQASLIMFEVIWLPVALSQAHVRINTSTQSHRSRNMAYNFDFLRDRYPSLFEPATQAERLILWIDNCRHCSVAIVCKHALEWCSYMFSLLLRLVYQRMHLSSI